MRIDIKNYLHKNLKHPKELDFTNEIIEYLVNLESEVSRYKAALKLAENAIGGALDTLQGTADNIAVDYAELSDEPTKHHAHHIDALMARNIIPMLIKAVKEITQALGKEEK